MTALLVGVSGALGAVARFLIDAAVRRILPVRFPVATVTINVTGSLVLGGVTAAIVERGAPGVLGLAAGFGFCGGYTTFSTAMVDTVRLARERRTLFAAANLLVQPAGCVLAVVAGYAVVAAG